MKRIYSLILLSLLIISSANVANRTCYAPGNMAFHFHGLKGKVKSTTLYSGIDVLFDEATKSWRKEEGHTYTTTTKTSYSIKGEEQETVVMKGSQLLAHTVSLYDLKCYLGFEQRDTLNKVIEKSILVQSTAADTYLEFQIYDGTGKKIKQMICREDTLNHVRTVEVKSVEGQMLFSQRLELNKQRQAISDIVCLNETSNCFNLSYEYIKFDKQGNWIERLERNSAMESVTLTERKIEYYK